MRRLDVSTIEAMVRPGRRISRLMAPKRIAVVDLGTNSTRLLVADVAESQVSELRRRTDVTRLGAGLDVAGRLSDDAMERVVGTVASYRKVADELGAERLVGVATSAVREAANGEEFRDALSGRFGLDVRTITGEEEARLTFLGATSGRDDGETLVLDIGGGSTEYVVGTPGADPGFHASTPLGSVRHTERHLHDDPPAPEQLAELSAEVERVVREQVGAEIRRRVEQGIAVAGTATSLAAIDQRLDPYDPARVHGYRLERTSCEEMLAMLAALPVDERREVVGLHPDRAPTIVAGAVILVESMRAFGLGSMETSEADILHGAALAAAGEGV